MRMICKIKSIMNWMRINKLTINNTKTNFMILTRKKYVHHISKIKIGQTTTNKVSETKYLDWVIDNSLLRKSHVNYIISKTLKKL